MSRLNTAAGAIDTTELMENHPDGWGDRARREAAAIVRLDELKSHGVTDEQLTTMLVHNPRRIFATQGGY